NLAADQDRLGIPAIDPLVERERGRIDGPEVGQQRRGLRPWRARGRTARDRLDDGVEPGGRRWDLARSRGREEDDAGQCPGADPPWTHRASIACMLDLLY